MLFQILDDKKDCLGIYSDQKFYYGKLKHSFSKTWDWSPHLDHSNYDFAKIWCGGKSLEEVCPDHLIDRYEIYRGKIKAFIKSADIAKINLEDICLFDMIPERHLTHYCQIKNEICEFIFKAYERPENHNFLANLSHLVSDISEKKVNINQNKLFKYSNTDFKAKTLWKSFGGRQAQIKYNMWGTVTGRLSTLEGSFPILNLKKDIADVVIPTNNMFVQLDFNGAEIRTLLSLSGKEQPKEDIHNWNIENVYRGIGTRDKAKQRFFAWLYNPHSQDHLTSRFYNREQILEKFYINGIISTPMGRKIESDNFHALNYLLQSTSSDNCIQQAIKINKFLKGRKSFVHSVVHDSITIDLHKDDKNIIVQLKEIFEDTMLGNFPSFLNFGKNYKDFEVVPWS